jgi:alcohol dehydrogenase (cytochrome c)
MLHRTLRRGALVLGAALAVVAGSAAFPQSASRAPAFGAPELVQHPAQSWVTNGGNVYNQRYSSLAQINRSNVAQVKAVWRTSLNGSGLGQGYSQQAQALFFAGVLYVVTGDNDVFAVDVETGKIIWTYEANVDFENTVICCGRLSRGVGLGDGKVYVGRLDARLVALDQLTGKVVWDVPAGDPGISEGITAAPLYYDGKVIVGFTGGEYAVRGRISAYDAKTGRRVWNFYTVPGPGEIGHSTWPRDNEAWKYGGAPVWQTPSVDPELGMIYFTTGNAAPDLNGAIREGDNLFTVSLVALDVATGQYRWHFQLVRHDIWDFDAANPTILFDADFDGMRRKGITAVSKAGYLYILDRTSGVPLTPVVETPVPQDAIQKTAATQPIPQGDQVVRHEVDAVGESFEGILRNRARTFTPFSTLNPAIWRPFSGVTWHPSSYNPTNNLMYLCAGDGPGRGTVGGDAGATIGPEPGDETRRYVQGTFGNARDIGTDSRSTLVAMNVTNHTVAWRRLLDNRCAGTINTAGGLIFAGRFNGQLTALDSDTGQRLWSFQTDGGFTTTATTFEHKGVQYLAGIAGGGVTGGRLNDGLWLFSLNGTIESLPAGSGDPPPADVPSGGADADAPHDDARAFLANFDLRRTPNPNRGAEIYATVCQTCHGPRGEGGQLGKPLERGLTIEDIMTTARSGVAGTSMPPFGNAYTLEELHDVASHIVSRVLPQR